MNQLFITAVSYDTANDVITVIVCAEQTHIATVEIAFLFDEVAFHRNTSRITTTFEHPAAQMISHKITNSAVLAALVVSKLDELTTADTEIALVIDVEAPIAI
jgi:hypothetical protein